MPVKQDTPLIRYLKWVRSSTQDIIIRGSDKIITFPLSTAFVSLNVSLRGKLIGDSISTGKTLETIDFTSLWPKRDEDDGGDVGGTTLPAESLLSLGSKIVLLGEAGSGKSTLLQYIAQQLSNAILVEDSGANERLGLICDHPIPIIVPLNAFANHLRSLPDTSDPHERTLLRFVEHYLILRHAYLSLQPGFFVDLLKAEQHVVLLLDGLDEVADEAQRIQISRAIQDLAWAPYHLSFVVTSRQASYRGESMLPADFQEVHVRPMDSRLVRRMIDILCTVLYPDDPIERIETYQKLVTSVEALERTRKQLGLGGRHLIVSPLMVRILITLFLRFGHVANRRTELYRDYVDMLLHATYNFDVTVANRLSESAGPKDTQRAALSFLAAESHIRSEHGISGLKEKEALNLLTEYLKDNPGINVTDNAKDKLLEAVRQRGGIAEFKDKEFRFTHLAFQEFLTANFICTKGTTPEDILDFFKEDNRLDRTWWREPLIHCLGLLHSEDEENANYLIRLILNLINSSDTETTSKLTLIDIVSEVCVERQLDREIKIRVADIICSYLFEQPTGLLIELNQRTQLGKVLGIIGDPRPDVASPIPSTLKIKGGTFLMGHQIDRNIIDLPSLQSGVYEIQVEEFSIAKYPTTNSQYEKFYLDGGYTDRCRSYWTEAGWEWKLSKNIHAPAFWDDSVWTPGNHPVVGISWFEAVAYCRWLSEQTGRHYRLPTEAEWEKSAKGDGGWPWGDFFSPDYANTLETGIGQTTCVGLFRLGDSSWGVSDLAGNVWEWCSSEFRTYGRYRADDGRELLDTALPRCIRGGSWLNNKDRARVANRDHYSPGDRHSDLGFRVAEDIE